MEFTTKYYYAKIDGDVMDEVYSCWGNCPEAAAIQLAGHTPRFSIMPDSQAVLIRESTENEGEYNNFKFDDGNLERIIVTRFTTTVYSAHTETEQEKIKAAKSLYLNTKERIEKLMKSKCSNKAKTYLLGYIIALRDAKTITQKQYWELQECIEGE